MLPPPTRELRKRVDKLPRAKEWLGRPRMWNPAALSWPLGPNIRAVAQPMPVWHTAPPEMQAAGELTAIRTARIQVATMRTRVEAAVVTAGPGGQAGDPRNPNPATAALGGRRVPRPSAP